jgi:thymidylate synthase
MNNLDKLIQEGEEQLKDYEEKIKMNKLDKQYTDLLQDILNNGVTKETRNGSTISVFGRQLRHDFRDGFPLLTTKKMAWKTMVTELLWFLKGDTNIKFLVDNGTSIWNGDAYKNYLKHNDEVSNYWIKKNPEIESRWKPFTKEEFINKIKTDDEFAKKWGELGPIYGAQWRSWRVGKGIETSLPHPDGGNIYEAGSMYIDQIQNLINDLKTNPDSRRLMVNAWNVGELDQMVLPPCHYGFQVYTRELSLQERVEIYGVEKINTTDAGYYEHSYAKFKVDEANIPTRAISLMWNQRSVDTFLGLPFNIASYGLLLEIIAKAVNMVPDELIGNLGDVHLYSNHIEQAKEQIGRDYSVGERLEFLSEKKPDFNPETAFGITKHIDSYCHYVIDDYSIPRRTREPYPLPKLNINSGNENWHLLDIDDIINSLDNELTFKLENYQSHPKISAPLSN